MKFIMIVNKVFLFFNTFYLVILIFVKKREVCEGRIGQLLLHCACNGGYRILSTTLTSQLLKNGSKIFMKGIKFIKLHVNL